MEPISTAILAGTSLLSGLLGSNAQSKANAANLAAQQNATNQQSFATMLQQAIAQRMLDAQLAPTTDVYGNRTSYTPGTGWATKLSPLQQAIADISQQATLQQAQTGSKLQDASAKARLSQQQGEQSLADAMFKRVEQAPTYSPTDVYNMQLEDAMRTTNRAFDDALDYGSRQAVRSGNVSGDYLGDVAKARRETIAQSMPSRMQSIRDADQLTNGIAGDRGQLYSYFANRAANELGMGPPQFSFNDPTQTMRSTLPGAASVGVSAVRAPYTIPQTRPDLGMSNALSSGGNLIDALLRANKKPESTRIGGSFDWSGPNTNNMSSNDLLGFLSNY